MRTLAKTSRTRNGARRPRSFRRERRSRCSKAIRPSRALCVRLKFPEHYAIPAHSHPTNEHVVVTSGALLFGMGDVLDKRSSANTKLTVGGFVDASANVNHFAFTRDEETTIVLYGEGPVEFNYVNPNDDPRNHPNAVGRR